MRSTGLPLRCAMLLFLSQWPACGVEQAEPNPVLVIAHRGASGQMPEHTLAAYRLAMEQGADFIEPDLRLTKDGELIALHDGNLARTTDVSDRGEFAHKARIDSKGRTYWSPSDFTIEEIRVLRTKMGHASRPQEHNGLEGIPTLDEIVSLVMEHHGKTGRMVGIIPEFKVGCVPEFVAYIKKKGFGHEEAGPPFYLQSFSLQHLKQAREDLDYPSAWLISRWPEESDWPDLRKHITAFAPAKRLILADDGAERIARAKAAGFQVIPWTFADDSFDRNRFPTAREELDLALENGIDAFFTDHSQSGVDAVIRRRGGSDRTP